MSGDSPVDYFFDTNILVYAYDRTAGKKHARASDLMKSCWEYENGCVSIQVLQEFFVTTTQKIKMPLEHQIARQIVEDLAHWRLHTPNTSDLIQAIDLMKAYQLSFWDAMIMQSASVLGCTQLLSEDLSHGQMYGGVQVINPFSE